jgi:hypothetical protein
VEPLDEFILVVAFAPTELYATEPHRIDLIVYEVIIRQRALSFKCSCASSSSVIII